MFDRGVKLSGDFNSFEKGGVGELTGEDFHTKDEEEARDGVALLGSRFDVDGGGGGVGVVEGFEGVM